MINLDLTDHKKVPSNPNEIRICCPFCALAGKPPDTKYHLYINTAKKVYYCFRCGARGRLSSLPRFIRSEGRSPNEKIDDSILVRLDRIADSKLGGLAVRYLKSRGMFDLKRFYLGIKGRWFMRVAVPITENRQIVSWIGRTIIKGQKPKYIFQRNTKPHHYLFNIDSALSYPQIFICEGIFDALSVPGGIAIMGKEASNVQVAKILTLIDENKPIFVALDADAQQEAEDLALKLAMCRPNIYLVGYRNCKDMNEVLIGKGEWFVAKRLS